MTKLGFITKDSLVLKPSIATIFNILSERGVNHFLQNAKFKKAWVASPLKRWKGVEHNWSESSAGLPDESRECSLVP